MPEPRKRDHPWWSVMPCAHFDAADSFLYEVQGWIKVAKQDMAYQDHYHPFLREAIGSADFKRKWATEIVFSHEEMGMVVSLFDVFDQGAVFILWQKKDDADKRVGFALKVDGVWHVVDEALGDEMDLPAFAGRESSGGMHVLEVKFAISNNRDPSRRKLLTVHRNE